ncbi:MAG: DEAD/DEAH box helicase family protein [Elusimicrobiota bacterium]
MDNDLYKKLQDTLDESSRLKEENKKLKELLSSKQNIPDRVKEHKEEFSSTKKQIPSEEKIKIFRHLFRGRDDVYAARWVSKTGKSGYSPVCVNEWDKKFCNKPEVGCSACTNRKHIPLTDSVIYNHLTGKQTIGMYPLLPDETCWFLAVDFDKSSWQADAVVYLSICTELDIPALLERSRSGNGCHVWIFFEENIPAALARKLGTIILTKALEKRYQIGFNSYDRFFPNQDTLPKGGFGNLIALPLQKIPRESGNTVFLNSDFEPYPDQWKLLASVKKISTAQLSSIVKNNPNLWALTGIKTVSDSDKEDDPWTSPPSKRPKDDKITESLPETIRIVQSNLIFIEKKGLTSKILKHILGFAAFQNPEFYKAQRMRISTFRKSRIISCGEDFSEYIGLPRGCMDEVLNFFKEHNVKPLMEDKRYYGNAIKLNFTGKLRPLQKKAVDILLEDDIGVISAGTAFGKTVIASYMISSRKTNTLILVHRKQLLEQWVKLLSTFLGIPEKSIGQIGGGKNKLTGTLDVAIIQSLFRKGVVKDIVADYGQIISDECHHISAFSFEQVMKQVKAKYVLGLTATPIRKDGHHPIIIMQCGPIVFRVTEKDQSVERAFEHLVIPRHTDLSIPDETNIQIQKLYKILAEDTARNELIIQDVLKVIKEGRSPLLLTERIDHLEHLKTRLETSIKNVLVFRGGMGRKQFRSIYDKLLSLPSDEERLILSTGRYIGEGFDDKRLDTLFLAMPISWRGTLAQYVGRLHRNNDNKKKVIVFDYIDVKIPRLKRMYDKRIKGYKTLGYHILELEILANPPQIPLFQQLNEK